MIFRNWLNAKIATYKIRQLPTIDVERFSLTFRITWTSKANTIKHAILKYTTRERDLRIVFFNQKSQQTNLYLHYCRFSWIYLLNESECIHLSTWFIVLYCIEERNKSNSILWNCGVLLDTGVCRYIASFFFFFVNCKYNRPKNHMHKNIQYPVTVKKAIANLHCI